MTRQIVVEMLDSGACTADFGEDHFTKRELLRVIRTIKQESKQQVRMYRRKQRLERLKGADNGKTLQTGEHKLGSSNSSEGSKTTAAASTSTGTKQSARERVAEAIRGTEKSESSLAAAVQRAEKLRTEEATG